MQSHHAKEQKQASTVMEFIPSVQNITQALNRGARGASTLSSLRTGATMLRPGHRKMNIACNGQTVWGVYVA